MKNFKHRRELKIITIFLFLSFNLIFSISFLNQFGSNYSFSNIGLNNDDSIIIEKELETDSRIVLPNVIIDANGDKISDKLFKKLNLKSRNVNNPQSASLSFIQDDFIDVIIDFNQKPDELIIDKLRYYGAEIKSVYSHVIYAVAAYIPVENITSIANNYEITFIEENSLCKSLLDTSTINIGARGSSYVWEAADPIKGNSSYSIAILDTGIDTTHPDMENVIYFEDFTDNGYPNGTSGTDYGHHGTHCASIAAGTGISDNNPRIINETFSNGLIDSTHYTPHYFEVKENVATPTLLNVTWDNKSGGSVDLVVYPSVGPALGSSISSETSSNFTLDLGNLVSDWYEIMFTPDSPSSSADGKNYSIQVQHEYNYTLSGDTIGTPVFPGVAPNSNLIGLKVLGDLGEGNSQWFLDALDWISENGTKSEFNITVVSMSLGFDGIYANIDQAVNSLVSDGFICVAAAGNDGTVQQIRSPGTAEKCITVGAINDAFEITYYSSNGNYTNYKPDVVAPGGTAAYSGSSSIGNLIIAADSNNNESDREMLDIGSNDYTGMQGTSMSCPHIAGIAQLAVDAIIKTDGSSWTWSEQNALKVKQLICMGTWELNQTESFDGDGISQIAPIDRISKDPCEGYGMTRADAVIQAITNDSSPNIINKQIYLDRRNETYSINPKVVLYPISMFGGEKYNISLTVPNDADFDLILYDKDYNTTNGCPIVNCSSINDVEGEDELISFVPYENGIYYWSVRAVNGSGTCEININSNATVLVNPNVTEIVAHDTFEVELECILMHEGSPVPGKEVNFTTDLGSLNDTGATSDGDGKFVFKLTSESISQPSIWANITFNSSDPEFVDVFQILFIQNDIPQLNSPQDKLFVNNTVELQSINWIIIDTSYSQTANYSIVITGGSSDLIEGDWGISKTISITISYRTIGTYNYSIEINDGYGGSDLDWVLVTITEPTDIDLFNLIIALGIVGIAFLLVGIIWKKA